MSNEAVWPIWYIAPLGAGYIYGLEFNGERVSLWKSYGIMGLRCHYIYHLCATNYICTNGGFSVLNESYLQYFPKSLESILYIGIIFAHREWPASRGRCSKTFQCLIIAPFILHRNTVFSYIKTYRRALRNLPLADFTANNPLIFTVIALLTLERHVNLSLSHLCERDKRIAGHITKPRATSPLRTKEAQQYPSIPIFTGTAAPEKQRTSWKNQASAGHIYEGLVFLRCPLSLFDCAHARTIYAAAGVADAVSLALSTVFDVG